MEACRVRQKKEVGGIALSKRRSPGRFGGKSLAAHLVWPRFGNVKNYIEPFAGSLAVLLGRPHDPTTETINDKDGFICNFWRATAWNPDAVVEHCDWPVNECDLHARHKWLVAHRAEMTAKLIADPEYFDAKVAGWWVWGICMWIGSGWCPEQHDPHIERPALSKPAGMGIHKQMPCISDTAGCGVHGKCPRPSGRAPVGIHKKRPSLGSGTAGRDGRGVHKRLSIQIPRLDVGTGVSQSSMHRDGLLAWFHALRDRLRNVRVCCGDWKRICNSPSTTHRHGLTGVFLDPPYSAESGRKKGIYAKDCLKVAHEVREWAIEAAKHPLMRIALCGYEGEHGMPDNWECVHWKAAGGYGNQGAGKENRRRERLWFSPNCLLPNGTLF